ncbi:MAG: 2Fe-2S iron-sulfur cluster binding domain-containing protein [Alphaproteobacteria bacterium]|nr:2Fe-2S iron-sulfur cluster binding domain-containing protein [Alphaproteobacteria bacterium]
MTVRVQDLELDTWLEFPCEPGEFVLDAAERAGFELPFSCRSGGCLVCTGKLVEGEVEMGEQYVLEAEHQANGFRLLCCTAVHTDSVFVGNQEHEVE